MITRIFFLPFELRVIEYENIKRIFCFNWHQWIRYLLFRYYHLRTLIIEIKLPQSHHHVGNFHLAKSISLLFMTCYHNRKNTRLSLSQNVFLTNFELLEVYYVTRIQIQYQIVFCWYFCKHLSCKFYNSHRSFFKFKCKLTLSNKPPSFLMPRRW